MNTNQTLQHNFGGPDIFHVMARALSLRPQTQDKLEGSDAVPSERQPVRRPLLDRLGNWLWRRDQRAFEAYLAGSQSIHELEARIRDVERRGHSIYG